MTEKDDDDYDDPVVPVVAVTPGRVEVSLLRTETVIRGYLQLCYYYNPLPGYSRNRYVNVLIV